MKELSLNVLDIAQNSIKAEATLVGIHICETEESLSFSIVDNGYGMTQEKVDRLVDPFYTTRTTRKVGLGIPFLKLAAEQTGGHIRVTSRDKATWPDEHGTTVEAVFMKNSIDFTPMGDITSTIITLIQGAPDIDFDFTYKTPNGEAGLSTMEMRQILGEDVALSSPDILAWASDYISEGLRDIQISSKEGI